MSTVLHSPSKLRLPQINWFHAFALLALLLAAGGVQAQNVEDGYAPGLNGSVQATVVQADGKALIGGEFTEVKGTPCAYICRLRADGSVDPTFASPHLDGLVLSVAVQADGKILIGGVFTSIDGQARKHVARLYSDGSLDTLFIGPDFNDFINMQLVLQADGKILAFGNFTSVSGQPRHHLARLNVDGSLDTNFPDTGATFSIHAVVQQADGKLIVGGSFIEIDGQRRIGLARLHANGTLDTSFVPADVGGRVNSLALRQDGKIMVGGYFSHVGGQPRTNLARLNSDGSLDPSFADLQLAEQIWSMAWQADGKLLLVGDHISYYGLVARLNVDGSLDSSFSFGHGANSRIMNLAVQSDGKVLIGGHFGVIDGHERRGLARLNVDGSLDVDMDDSIDDVGGGISTVALLPDGKIMASEYFTYIDYPNHHVTRRNHDGRIDPGFSEAVANGVVSTLVAQSDGKVLVGGQFSTINGQPHENLVRLHADGSVDGSFPSFDSTGSIREIVLQPDGKILIYGDFYQIENQARTLLARLHADGTLDTSFLKTPMSPNFSPTGFELVLQADGKMLVVGPFSKVGDQTLLPRLNTNGTWDTTFLPPTQGRYSNLMLQPDGKLLAYNDQFGLLRLHSSGSRDTSFTGPVQDDLGWGYKIALQSDGKIAITHSTEYQDYVMRVTSLGLPDLSFTPLTTDNRISVMMHQADGKLLLAGDFNSVNSGTRSHLARVSLPIAALQSLDVVGNTATWRRSGTAPELSTAPMLSYSSDGIAYTALGLMTRVLDGWQRSDVPLLEGFYYVRAEARIGNAAGDGLIQSVRQVYRPAAEIIFSNGFDWSA